MPDVPPPATPAPGVAPAVSPAPAVARPFLPGPEVLPVIGERLRWAILSHLVVARSLSVKELMGMLKRDRSLVSQHLHTLIASGVVRQRREGITDRRSHQYEVVPHWRAAGEPAVLDFGCARVRFGAGG